MTGTHVVRRGEGEVCDLGIISMRVLVDAKTTGGAFSVLEFHGGAGPWTVPHAHHKTEESFYVVAGTFDFECGGDETTATVGDYVLIPRGTSHMITARPGGGTLLGVIAPAGLENMFRELSRLGPDRVRDPATRREISGRFDAVPV